MYGLMVGMVLLSSHFNCQEESRFTRSCQLNSVEALVLLDQHLGQITYLSGTDLVDQRLDGGDVVDRDAADLTSGSGFLRSSQLLGRFGSYSGRGTGLHDPAARRVAVGAGMDQLAAFGTGLRRIVGLLLGFR